MELEMRGIKKSFGSNLVLDGVDLHLSAGQVHALMGENGAGKSTLMNILTGLFEQDAGSILVNGQEKQYENPSQAEEDGIYFIHQEMVTFPEMTVLDNLYMGKFIKKSFGLVDTAAMRKGAERVFDQLGVQIDLDAKMYQLSVGQQQLVEIGKSLMGETQLIIMDEPTAALTDRESDKLFAVIKQLTEKGVGIVYISHRMNEIFEISDMVTVMRDGRSVITAPTRQMTEETIVQNMVGRDLGDYYPEVNNATGETVFSVNGLSKAGVFQDISFDLKEGEILGISGLMGSGRTEIMRALFGLDDFDSGTLSLHGETFQPKSPQDSIQRGLGFLTEDRKDEGLILGFSIRDNMSLPIIKEFSKGGIISKKDEETLVDMLRERLAIRSIGSDQMVGDLSGGNQQKVVLAKWIAAQSQVLILDEPTRGVDVGAKQEIYNLLNELTERGVSIIMVSSDLPEVIGLSDRVVVISEGQITGEVSGQQINEEDIMTLATGGQL